MRIKNTLFVAENPALLRPEIFQIANKSALFDLRTRVVDPFVATSKPYTRVFCNESGLVARRPSNSGLWDAKIDSVRFGILAFSLLSQFGIRSIIAVPKPVKMPESRSSSVRKYKNAKKVVSAKKPAEADGVALASAALRGQVDIVRTLLESGADPNFAGEEHFTVLMSAVRAGRIEIVHMLLKAGAGLNALNEGHQTALDIAYDNLKVAKDRGRCFKMMNGTREVIRVIKSRCNEDEITTVLKQAGGKRGQDLKSNRAPLPAEPERERKEYVEVEVPDFNERAKKPEFQKAIAEVALLTGKHAKPVANDEGHPLAGGVSFQVPAEVAEAILKEHHEAFLKRGCYLFKSDHGYANGKGALTLLPTTSRADVLAAYQTNGANCEVYTADVIHWLDELEKKQPFLMTGAGFDWCEGVFTKPLMDSKKLAKQMYGFCPDIVDQGIEGVSHLAIHLKKTQRFFFWWD